MENHDMREALHKTADMQFSRILNTFNHLLGDARILASEGGVEHADITAFQMKIHHLALTQCLQVLQQMAADLDLSSLLLDHEKRSAETRATREKLEAHISAALSSESQVYQRLLNVPIEGAYMRCLEQAKMGVPLANNDEDDEVVFEGGGLAQYGFSEICVKTLESKPNEPLSLEKPRSRVSLLGFP